MDQVEEDPLVTRLSDLLSRHDVAIGDITSYAPHVFEALCFMLFVRYYEEVGYRLEPRNLSDKVFKFRFSTSGHPWNFSYFVAFRGNVESEADVELFEIRHNQLVAGAWIDDTKESDEDRALFAVDIAVIEGESLPDSQPSDHKPRDRYWVKNDCLITFAEVKKLTAYPMLLAQFLGSVHEIKPEFVRVGQRRISRKFLQDRHLPPTLMTSSYITPGTKRVLRSFESRKLIVRVVEDVTGLPEEGLLSQLRPADGGQQASEIGAPVPF